MGDGVAMSVISGRFPRNHFLERDDYINARLNFDHRSPRWELEPQRWGVTSACALHPGRDVAPHLAAAAQTLDRERAFNV